MSTEPLPAPVAGKDAALVQRMFDRIAPRYDLANTIFSAGQDRHWRELTARVVAPRPGEVVVDVAAGTGALSRLLARQGATVVALDFSWPMLSTGARRQRAGWPEPVTWCNGDGTRLPLADRSVDVLTIAFGLRNLPDPATGLAEFARVVRPGGQLAVLEFSHPTNRLLRTVYERYLVDAIPSAARWLASDPGAYRYLAESILAWPHQREMAAIIAGAGWSHVRYKNLSGGIVALHHARRS